MDNTYIQKIMNADKVFGSYFIDGRAYYLHTFNRLPDVNFIGSVDGEKILKAVKENFPG